MTHGLMHKGVKMRSLIKFVESIALTREFRFVISLHGSVNF